MQKYDRECLQVFLEQQHKLFENGAVAETMGQTETFLQENMAVIANSPEEVKQYFEENGGDISGMSMEEILGQSEVFKLEKTGRYLIVEA